MTDSAGDEDTPTGRHFSTGVKSILTAGAVATALAAIIGLGQAVWPDPDPPPERMSARISGLQVDQKVPLAEYLEDTKDALGATGKTAWVPRTVFAGASGAASSPKVVAVEAEPEPEPVSQPAPEPAPERQRKVEPETQTQTNPAPTPLPPTTVTSPDPAPPPPPRPQVVEALIAQIETEPLEDVMELSESGVSQEALEAVPAIFTGDEDAPHAELRTVVASSRLQVTQASDGAPRLSPLGVVVNFSAQIDGYRGKRAVVRWSLFDARERTRMPQAWLRNRPALRLVPEAGSDRGSPAVWVPLPRERGPYFVRLELFDDRGNRLDKADTKSFDR